MKNILYLVLILLGGALFVYGEIDDSPGGQLMAVGIVIFGIVMLIKKNRKSKD